MFKCWGNLALAGARGSFGGNTVTTGVVESNKREQFVELCCQTLQTFDMAKGITRAEGMEICVLAGLLRKTDVLSRT